MAQSSMGTVSAQGSTVWVLIRRRNSSLSRSMALVTGMQFPVPEFGRQDHFPM